jgi:hypothetical protein
MPRLIVAVVSAAFLLAGASVAEDARAQSRAKPTRAKPAPKKKPKKGKPGEAEAAAGDAAAGDSGEKPTAPEKPAADKPTEPKPAEAKPKDTNVVGEKEDKSGVKTYQFRAQEIEGRMKSPQVAFFLRRVRAEFAAGDLGHRSFLGELQHTRHRAEFR